MYPHLPSDGLPAESRTVPPVNRRDDCRPGMLGQGRYTALLRDDRMVQDLALNSLRVADALISAANPQA